MRLETAFCSKQDSCREIILTGLNLLKEFDDSRHGQSWMHATRPVVVHKYLLWVVERNFTKITILSFNGSNDFDQKLWSILEANPQLFEHISHLHICNCNSDRVWTLVGRCPNLTELTLFNEPNVMLMPIDVDPVGGRALSGLCELTTLHIVLLESNSAEPLAFETHLATLFMLIEFCPNLEMVTFTFPVFQWQSSNPTFFRQVVGFIECNYEDEAEVKSAKCRNPQCRGASAAALSFGVVTIEFFPVEQEELEEEEENDSNESASQSTSDVVVSVQCVIYTADQTSGYFI